MDKYYEKSVQNLVIAKIAEEKGYYEVALSRYYYNIYLIVCGVILSNNPNYKFPSGKYSHVKTITHFMSISNFSTDEKTHIRKIGTIRRARNDYEYNSFIIDVKKEFNDQFMASYIEIEKIMDKSFTSYSEIKEKILKKGE